MISVTPGSQGTMKARDFTLQVLNQKLKQVCFERLDGRRERETEREGEGEREEREREREREKREKREREKREERERETNRL